VPILGIEPAQNIAQVAQEKGIRTLPTFFGQMAAANLRATGEMADVIHAHNVLAHVADLNGVVAGFQQVLKDDGVVVVETPYIKDLIDHVEFDTIYHEHLCYYSLAALDQLFQRHNLLITHVERVAIHGGTLRIFAEHSATAHRRDSVRTLLAEEETLGLRDFAFYRYFGLRVETLKANLLALTGQLKQAGHSIAACSASAKGAR
jgi:SAM-dependent methyltransferase